MTSTISGSTTDDDLLVDTEAVVLVVGGKGTRLRPLTISAPKPMLPTAGLPFLTHLLSRIRAAGIRRVCSDLVQAEVFEEHFGDGSDLDLEISYVVEAEPLGTGGGIRNVLGGQGLHGHGLQRRRAGRHGPAAGAGDAPRQEPT